MKRLSHKSVIQEFIESALRELSDAGFQQRVWISGSPIEMSSMNEVVAALFDDSGLAEALEKNDITFTREVDAELRELRVMLRSSLIDQDMYGAAAVIDSPGWQDVRGRAFRVLKMISARH